MGVNLKDLIVKHEIGFPALKGKVLVVDSYNMLYQFLANIRSQEGALFTDRQGNVTSHLIGLLSRTLNFIDKGLKLVFVFDGEVPKLKATELHKRRAVKEAAAKEYEKALKRKDVVAMRKYAARTSMLTREMVAQAKELLDLLGQPVVQAPSEGEAQAAHMVANNDGWAVASQDYDSLLYGAPRLVQNLSLAGKRKKSGTLGWVTVTPQLIDLKENLEKLQLTREQLIAAAMLVGTDFAPGGVRGLGPKKAIALVKRCGNDRKRVFEEAKWDEHNDVKWQDVYALISTMPVTSKYCVTWKMVNVKGVIDFLHKQHDFSKARLEKQLSHFRKAQGAQSQKGLGAFL